MQNVCLVKSRESFESPNRNWSSIFSHTFSRFNKHIWLPKIHEFKSIDYSWYIALATVRSESKRVLWTLLNSSSLLLPSLCIHCIQTFLLFIWNTLSIITLGWSSKREKTILRGGPSLRRMPTTIPLLSLSSASCAKGFPMHKMDLEWHGTFWHCPKCNANRTNNNQTGSKSI